MKRETANEFQILWRDNSRRRAAAKYLAGRWVVGGCACMLPVKKIIFSASHRRKISFLTHPAACQFEELRNKFGSDEVQAWEEYRKLNPFLENTIVTPEKYVDASRRGRGLTTTRAAAPAQHAIKRGPSNEAAVNCISNNNLCFMCKDGGGKLTISAARPILDPET